MSLQKITFDYELHTQINVLNSESLFQKDSDELHRFIFLYSIKYQYK